MGWGVGVGVRDGGWGGGMAGGGGGGGLAVWLTHVLGRISSFLGSVLHKAMPGACRLMVLAQLTWLRRTVFFLGVHLTQRAVCMCTKQIHGPIIVT